MNKKITWHLQQNTTLNRVIAILEFFDNQQEDLEQLAINCQVKTSVLKGVIFPFLRNLSILSKNSPLSFTDQGIIATEILKFHPDLLGDFLHLVLYNLHINAPDKRFSWMYSTIVNQLWLRKEVLLSQDEKKRLVEEAIATAALQFDLPESEIAFSGSSITGVLNWLRSLTPTVIKLEANTEFFSRRYFCAAPSLIKAVDTIYQQRERTYGVKIFLREDIKEAICRMLLLDPSGLDSALDNAKRTYDYDQGDACFRL